MTLEEFADLLDRLGAARTHWPPGAAGAVDRLLERSPEARKMLLEAERLDAALHASRVSLFDPRGTAERAWAHPQRRAPPAPVRIAVGLAAAAAVLSLGVLSGARRPPSEDPRSLIAWSLNPIPETQDAD